MDPKLLVKQFTADPGTAFLEVIRAADGTTTATQISALLTSAGARSADVKDKWKKLQPFIARHPNIKRPSSTKYEWTPDPITSRDALQRLSSYLLKSTPAWLAAAYVQTVSDSLAAGETTGASAQSTWTEERDLQKAQVLAETMAEVERFLHDKAPSAEILAWLTAQADRRRLSPIARIGEQVPFDPETQHIQGDAPQRGERVRVVRSGYKWAFAGREDVALRAVVEK